MWQKFEGASEEKDVFQKLNTVLIDRKIWLKQRKDACTAM